MTALCNMGTHVAVNRIKYPLAATLGKTVLYKFRSYSNEEERKRVREILVDHKVYFARASQVNDPFDLNPCIDIPSREDYLDGLKKYLRSTPQISEEDGARRIAVVNSPDFDFQKHRVHVQDKTRRRLEDVWIFSLAGNRDHPMQWSHYAAGHTGVRPHADARFPIQFNGQHAFFDPNELCGLTLGARMRAGEVQELRKLAATHVPNLPVWRAKESHSDYSLEFELLDGA